MRYLICFLVTHFHWKHHPQRNQKAQLWTDLQVNEDGYISFLVPHAGMGSRQAGRVARRITEVEIYRMASMLAFPVAKSLSGPLRNAEAELSELSKEISMAQNQESVQQLIKMVKFLERISTLASKIEEWISEHGLRFTAAEAYSQLTAKNLEELSEASLPGVQTLSEFMERRFAPAMSTCSWTQRRLRELSDRISRTTQILRTRIEFVNESQTQELLASMDRRAKIQLRLTRNSRRFVSFSINLLRGEFDHLHGQRRQRIRLDGSSRTHRWRISTHHCLWHLRTEQASQEKVQP
jgi:uncharacterized membrane-anchored protein